MTSFDAIVMEEKLTNLKLSTAVPERGGKRPHSEMVDNYSAVKSMLDILTALERDSGSIYLDLEGVNLSRHGSISLIQIYLPSHERVFLVDVHTMGKRAFEISSSHEKTLKSVLESQTIKKYLFDVRNDADALYALFSVELAGVVDIQLLELASRKGHKHVVAGLAACMEQEQALPLPTLLEWQITKKSVRQMLDPKSGGSYDIFNLRPLPQVLVDYCVGDVQSLPILAIIYKDRLSNHWSRKAQAETEQRLKDSRGASYEPQGRKKIFAPKSWRFLPQEKAKSASKPMASAAYDLAYHPYLDGLGQSTV